MKTFSKCMETLSPNYFTLVGAKISAMRADGRDVIRLDIGSPDLPPAPHILEALIQSASHSDHHGYQPFNGTPALRRAWAGMYKRVFDVELDPEYEIVSLIGSKEGIFHLTMACIEPGDVVLVPDPAYATYARGAHFAGGEVVFIPLLKELELLPDLSGIPPDIARRARLLWLNYPNNPTTATATLEFFSAAVAFAKEYEILLCHDAAYTQVTYEGYRAPSLLQVPSAKEVAVEFNTLSKSHNMAGWRVGVAVGNRQALGELRKLKPNVDSGHFLPIMDAATIALTEDQAWLNERNQVYRKRRDLVIQKLQTLGMPAASPRASLYVWSPVPEGWTSIDFTETILEKTGVSLTPGTVFGAQGEGYTRISLGAPTNRIIEGLERLTDWWLTTLD